MDTFKDFELSASPQEQATFVETVENRLTDGWTRGTEYERRGGPENDLTCFACDARGDRRAATLWLAKKGEDLLYISNIVPLAGGQLSYSQYNAILDEFVEAYAQPVADLLGLSLFTTPGTFEVGEVLSEAAHHSLLRFSGAANKSTGSSHPNDRARWIEFLTRAHRDETLLTGPELFRFLTEKEAWPPDIARELEREFEFAAELLSSYDRG